MTNLKTKIEWCDVTWSPVTGCRKISAGCANCYASTWAKRGMGQWKGREFEDVRVHEDRLDAPLRWRKPRRVFVNSMSDLFHEDVPDEFIDKVFAVMAQASQHTFLVLTKRPERMRALLACDLVARVCDILNDEWRDGRRGVPIIEWPIPNVHLGVSCEDQRAADERVPILLDTPAVVRWVSAEPLLGPIDFSPWMDCGYESGGPQGWVGTPSLDWVVVGGESGPGARPCDVAWIRDIVSQCGDAGVPVFVKQVGTLPVLPIGRGDSVRERAQDEHAQALSWPEGTFFGNRTGDVALNGRVALLRDRKGGDPSEWPEDLRVREFPR